MNQIASALPTYAPTFLVERPPDAACAVCGRPVAPYESRHGWLARTMHQDCRLRHEKQLVALDDAREKVDRVVPKQYQGFSLGRLAPITAPKPGALLVHGSNADAVRVLKSWEPGQSVVLEGPVGTGKTALLAAFTGDQLLMLTPADTTRSVRFFTETDLVEALKRRMRENRTANDDHLAWALSAHALVIDDVGTARPTEWWDEQFGALVDHAYKAERSLVFSTNLDGAALAERYPTAGDRMVSRLEHMTGNRSRWVTVGGVNWRKR